jgi:hypothetical protein
MLGPWAVDGSFVGYEGIQGAFEEKWTSGGSGEEPGILKRYAQGCVEGSRRSPKILAFLYRTLRPLVPTLDCRAYLARRVLFVGSCEAPRDACSSYVAKL